VEKENFLAWHLNSQFKKLPTEHTENTENTDGVLISTLFLNNFLACLACFVGPCLMVSILVLMELPLPGQAGKHEIQSTKFETKTKLKNSKFKTKQVRSGHWFYFLFWSFVFWSFGFV
jgi:hypothetical protein